MAVVFRWHKLLKSPLMGTRLATGKDVCTPRETFSGAVEHMANGLHGPRAIVEFRPLDIGRSLGVQFIIAIILSLHTNWDGSNLGRFTNKPMC